MTKPMCCEFCLNRQVFSVCTKKESLSKSLALHWRTTHNYTIPTNGWLSGCLGLFQSSLGARVISCFFTNALINT